MDRARRILALCLTSLLASAAAPRRALAEVQAADEYAAKAAFIYNIALFSSFANATGVVHLCVLGRDPFGSMLTALDGKALGRTHLAIVNPRSSVEALAQCQILFIGASEADDLATLAERAKAAGVLSIADVDGAARRGVMLELGVDERRIAFEFNASAARAAGISLSSKVLRLARAIH